MSVLRRIKVDGEWRVEIPDENWLCPKCGAGCEGDDEGLILGGNSEGELIPEGDYVDCNKCNWDGMASDVYWLAAGKEKLVTCPTCKGRGTVEKR